ncbi:GPP34-domain-containing protein [Mycena sanguinolenta]|uniref:GPP34-domain-containing protein n=1 Tax=Mycena sanguinolenta TaxID=230812 RepID=A0A8H6Y076_9AGAR|nr:GPP34-domain-containing protein [Mycena sanguinolenta]
MATGKTKMTSMSGCDGGAPYVLHRWRAGMSSYDFSSFYPPSPSLPSPLFTLLSSRCDEILGEFGIWPFGCSSESPSSSKRKPGVAIASGPGGVDMGRESVRGLVAAVRAESATSGGGAGGADEDAGFELVAAVFEVLSKLDSLL